MPRRRFSEYAQPAVTAILGSADSTLNEGQFCPARPLPVARRNAFSIIVGKEVAYAG